MLSKPRNYFEATDGIVWVLAQGAPRGTRKNYYRCDNPKDRIRRNIRERLNSTLPPSLLLCLFVLLAVLPVIVID